MMMCNRLFLPVFYTLPASLQSADVFRADSVHSIATLDLVPH